MWLRPGRSPGESPLGSAGREGLVAVQVTARAGLAGWSGAGVRVGGVAVAADEELP
jgi:hypothetical protein